MNINTKYFGTIEVAEKEQIVFPKGLFGFENYKSYYLLPFEESEGTLLCLQSSEEPFLAFVLLNPFHIEESYRPQTPMEDLRELKVQSDSSIAFYVITVVHDPFLDSTVNLKCPIAINLDKKIGKQIMLEDSSYSLRHPIHSEDGGK